MLDEFPETLVNIEWHSSGYTPGDSDFDDCIYYESVGACYGVRASMYGVGGIPHTQWNGVQETVGGYPDGNLQAIIGTFEALYASMVGDDTPYEIDINGYVGEQVSYDVTVYMDADMSNSNQKVDIFVVEDNIWSYWSGASS